MATITFYKDPKEKLLHPTLFSDMAENLARNIGTEGERNRRNKRTQLRKFYDEVVRLNGLARTQPAEWDSILPYVHMIIAKAAYAEGRKLVSGSFVSFMKDSVQQVRSPEDLDIFANFFEAFMGFYKKYGSD